jgi:hypothetical protein
MMFADGRATGGFAAGGFATGDFAMGGFMTAPHALGSRALYSDNAMPPTLFHASRSCGACAARVSPRISRACGSSAGLQATRLARETA